MHESANHIERSFHLRRLDSWRSLTAAATARGHEVVRANAPTTITPQCAYMPGASVQNKHCATGLFQVAWLRCIEGDELVHKPCRAPRFGII